MSDEQTQEMQNTLARVELKVDNQQDVLTLQRKEMEKISTAIVTIARLDEHLLRFREEDREAKKRLWHSIEGHAVRIRAVEEATATIKDTRNIAIAFLLAIAGGVVTYVATIIKSSPPS